MKKEEVINNGWKWRDENNEFVNQNISYKIEDDISNIRDDICQSILICEVSKKPYKIVSQELDFYREMKLPIPKYCPNQRHFARMSKCNQIRLYNRKCDKCGKEIQTTYAPDRKEIVYCEECYLGSIY